MSDRLKRIDPEDIRPGMRVAVWRRDGETVAWFTGAVTEVQQSAFYPNRYHVWGGTGLIGKFTRGARSSYDEWYELMPKPVAVTPFGVFDEDGELDMPNMGEFYD